MIKIAQNSRKSQDNRLKIKTLSTQMQNVAVEGAGLSPWEAEVLVNEIENVYFSDPDLRQATDGQLKYSCISIKEPAGKKVESCQMVSVMLTLFDSKEDSGILQKGKAGAVTLRQRRIMRITEEAKEQGGLLSQEDLGKILMSDPRTIRRDIKNLKEIGIIVATRGQVKDIGPGVSHKGVAVRLWLEGKEVVEIARHINHNLKSVENYIEKFKRVVYLRGKNFDDYQSALTIGISVASVKTFVQLYHEFKNKTFFKSRISEINLVGSQHYIAEDKKKDSPLLIDTSKGGISK